MKRKRRARGRPVTKEFKLRPHDRGKLEKIRNEKSKHSARTHQRAEILLRLAKQESMTSIAERLGITRNMVHARRELYVKYGLERALATGPGRGRKRTILEEHEQQIVAIACSEPPEGASHWSCRLLAEEAKRRQIVESISITAVHIILQRHELKPWREKNVVRS